MNTNSKRDLKSFDFENISDYSLQLNRWFLISLGAWPQGTSSTVKRIVVSMQILIFSSSIAIITIPCMLYVSFEREDIQTKLSAVVPLLHRIMGSVNYWTLLTRHKDIYNCIRHMETDWKLVQKIDDREVMLQYAKIGRFMAGFCAVFMHGSAFFFTVVRAIKTTTITVGNETFTMHPMTCPVYSKIIDARFSPANEIFLGVQVFSAFVVGSSTVAVCSLAAVFAMHACGQLNVLYMWLNELVKYDEKKNLAEQRLAAIVEHHLRVLSFIANMESIMHKACLAELMGCTLNMCLLGYYSIMNWAAFDAAKILSYVTVYMSMSFNIFIFCYIGEILTEQCKHVGEIAYMTNWYKLPHKTALGLVLIIMRSSLVIKITAGKLFQLSIATFGDIIKTSMAYLNILRTMTT
ncbi:odorant receptor 82a-like isoform X3 [Linepithema humile]|uniref:odorant receptor 82a-like isoform X3 n=1 Tax=Linepithema humile TaxID=83485 RepID=UPI00062372AD|nr:PREDICTED: odorant receptor 82a-like [Linepithema humile]